MVLYGLFCYNDCNRIGRNAYYKINDKGRLRNERWGILSLRRLFMDQKNVSQIETKTHSFKRSYYHEILLLPKATSSTGF